jgi:2-polyprenyl-3-methyl-5-hydroxy-6-metoxy-1,4-benzoquinol methylase
MIEFSDEALRLVSAYAKQVENEIHGLAADLKPEYIRMLVFDIENDVKFFALKEVVKRKSQRIEALDVDKVSRRFGKPKEFVRSHLGKAQNCVDSQRITLSNLGMISEKLKKIKNPLILDAGCRWGRVSRRLKSFCSTNFEIIGVDLDKLPLQYGRILDKNAAFLCSDIEALPFRKQVFDVTLCSGVIHEVKDMKGRRRAIKEMSQIIRPKGLLCLVDAFTNSRIASALTFMFQHIIHTIEWIPKKTTMESMLRDNGFDIVSVQTSGLHLAGTIAPYTITAMKTNETSFSQQLLDRI